MRSPSGAELRDALDAVPCLRRVKGSPVTLPPTLIFGSVAEPQRPRLYADEDRIVMVAGTSDPLPEVRHRTVWALTGESGDA